MEAFYPAVAILLIAAVFVILLVGICQLSGSSLERIGSTPESSGNLGEEITRCYLDRLPAQDYLCLNDVMVEDSRGLTTQIDHVVVSRFGIFVIETKCYSGWIFGDEGSKVWTQTLPCGRGWWARAEKHTFQNPIKQNWRHIYVLSERLNLPKRYFINAVVFAGTAIFKTRVPDNVMNEQAIVPFIRCFDKPIIRNPGRIAALIHSLDCSVPNEKRAAHVVLLHVAHEHPELIGGNDQVPHCPRCGAEMRLRHRRSDDAPFYGCSRYPDCKGIVNIETGEW